MTIYRLRVSAKAVMKSDTLRLMARELAEMVKKMPSLNWTPSARSVRADLPRKVRRLLAMYGYPPDLSEDATQLVLKQAELPPIMATGDEVGKNGCACADLRGE